MRFFELVSDAFRLVWTNTDRITKWIQIVALGIAAYWTYTRFLSGERPNLEIRVDLSTSLKDERPGPTPDTCYVYFGLELKNQGIVSFDVENVRIQAWRSDLPTISSGDVRLINPKEFERGQQIIDNSDAGLLNMHFAPGESAVMDFAWVFRARPPGIYFFVIDIDAVNNQVHKHIS